MWSRTTAILMNDSMIFFFGSLYNSQSHPLCLPGLVQNFLQCPKDAGEGRMCSCHGASSRCQGKHLGDCQVPKASPGNLLSS